jgi:hypothetical protein
MTEKRMPAAERRRETTIMMPVLQLVVVDELAGYRAPVPGRESGLTRSGESVKRKRS